MARTLTQADLRQVEQALILPSCSRPPFADKPAMVAARPAWLPETAAEHLCDVLCSHGFSLSPNAPGEWSWDKHVPLTAILHSVVFMPCLWKGLPWLKSYSYDLCAGLYEDALGDSHPDLDAVSDMQPVLALFRRNEDAWHSVGFSVINEI